MGSGRVLVSGGFTGTANNNFIAPFPLGLLQVYGPDTGAWSDLEPAAGPGLLYSSVSLADGGVLFVGLTEVESGVASMASIFDPAGDSWARVPGPTAARANPHLVLLEDGRVLAAGGLDFSNADAFARPEVVQTVEIYDPASQTWRAAASLKEASSDQWLFLLRDGRVVSLGTVVDDSSDTTTNAEVYDPAANEWTLVSDVEPYYAPNNAVQLSDGRLLVLGALSARRGHSTRNGQVSSVELPDGRVLDSEEIEQQFPDAKIYDPQGGTWTPAGGMSATRANASLTLLPDGRVLAAGGEDPEGADYLLHSTTEIFDPSTNTWSPGPDLAGPRTSHTATLLPDGQVLLTGGIGINLEIDERFPLQSTEFVGIGAAPPASLASLSYTPVALCPPDPAPTLGGALTPAPPGTSPLAVLDAAREATAAADSYHLEMDTGGTIGSEGSIAHDSTRLSMDYQTPDLSAGCFALLSPYFGFIELQMYVVGDDTYATDPKTSEWRMAGGSQPFDNALDFMNDDIAASYTGLALEGVENLDGVSCYRIAGSVPADVLAEVTLFADLVLGEGGTLSFVYWVGVTDGLVKRFTTEGSLEVGEGKTQSISIEIRISKIGEELAIEVSDLSGA